MADNLQRIFSGIDSCKDVKKSHPDKMPGKHQYDDLQKNRQLSGDGSLVGKAAEGSADEQRKNGDDDPCNQRKNDLLKFIQKSL